MQTERMSYTEPTYVLIRFVCILGKVLDRQERDRCNFDSAGRCVPDWYVMGQAAALFCCL